MWGEERHSHKFHKHVCRLIDIHRYDNCSYIWKFLSLPPKGVLSESPKLRKTFLMFCKQISPSNLHIVCWVLTSRNRSSNVNLIPKQFCLTYITWRKGIFLFFIFYFFLKKKSNLNIYCLSSRCVSKIFGKVKPL